MLVVSTSEFSPELVGYVVPWGIDRSPHGPPAITAKIGDEKFVCRVGKKPSFSDAKRGGNLRLKGFGGGVFRFARDVQALRISEQSLAPGEVLSLVTCAEDEEDIILLGALCSKSEKEPVLLPVGSEILFSAQSTELGHSVSVFAARIMAENGFVVASSAKGLGSFVDCFNLQGHQVLPRREVEDLIDEVSG